MKIPEVERQAIGTVVALGAEFGYGNLISHLQTAWARTMMEKYGFDEEIAREASGGPGYPFLMQADLIARGEWDESGKRYAPPRKKRSAVTEGTKDAGRGKGRRARKQRT